MENDKIVEKMQALELRVLSLESELAQIKEQNGDGGVFLSSSTPDYVSKYLKDKKAKRDTSGTLAERGD